MTKMNKRQLGILKDQFKAGILIIVMALFIAVLLNITYLFSDIINLAPVVLLIINVTILFLTFFVVYLFNKEVYRDLKNKELEEVKSVILQKHKKEDYEPGSGALFIPILGNLFPKIWGQNMKEVYRYEIITKEKKVEIDKDLYESLHIGDEVILCYGKHSKTFLGIRNA